MMILKRNHAMFTDRFIDGVSKLGDISFLLIQNSMFDVENILRKAIYGSNELKMLQISDVYDDGYIIPSGNFDVYHQFQPNTSDEDIINYILSHNKKIIDQCDHLIKNNSENKSDISNKFDKQYKNILERCNNITEEILQNKLEELRKSSILYPTPKYKIGEEINFYIKIGEEFFITKDVSVGIGFKNSDICYHFENIDCIPEMSTFLAGIDHRYEFMCIDDVVKKLKRIEISKYSPMVSRLLKI